MASLAVPNSSLSLNAFAWMDDYFDLVGQPQPNGIDVELEATPIDEIYDEYCCDNLLYRQDIISISAFETLWKECFPRVKRREYLAVGGKCHTCADLSLGRKTHKGREDREHLKMLHHLHRTGYMNERISYYARRQKACAMPHKYLSFISDGMMQMHCQMPWYGNLDMADYLQQHIQGVLAHGRFMNVFRTFHNVYNDSNMQIYTFLRSLEKVYDAEGFIPDDVFLQLDGGQENVSKNVIGLCELLAARGIIKRLHLTRLMVGHTHEDIDGRFALIWKRVRSAFVLTMSEYEKCIHQALSKDDLPCEVEDLFAIPDFDAFIRPHLDPNFGRYARRVKDKDWTVLQFKFEHIAAEDPLYPLFPLGCRTTWRPFAAKNHVRIVKDRKAPCGMTFDNLTDIENYPPAQEGVPKGMYVLQKFPTGEIPPEPFVPGSRALLESVCNSFCESYNTDLGNVYANEWINFKDNIAPQSDDAEEWVKDHPLHIPFHDTLVHGAPMRASTKDTNAATTGVEETPKTAYVDRSRKSKQLDYVSWSRRGVKKKRNDPCLHYPNLVYEGPDDVNFSVPVFCKSKKGGDADAPTSLRETVAAMQIPEDKMAVVGSKDSPVAESSSDDESDDDSVVTTSSVEDGWVTCRSHHNIFRYGDPNLFLGKTFTVPEAQLAKCFITEKCS
jgi:hypothetical protein